MGELLRILIISFSVIVCVACGDNNTRIDPDGGPPGGAVCGNNIVEEGEQCDNVNRMLCAADCKLVCGNGLRETFETCDTAISSGMDSCPASCDDNKSCTTDGREGAGCQVVCTFGDITARVNGDGCCPAGTNNNNDDKDCPIQCGNKAVEKGETCDTGITDGFGTCPSLAACNDQLACTTDTLIFGDAANPCTADCKHTEITASKNDDGCCPAGKPPDDNDCVSVLCGNGKLNPGEKCDKGIPAGEPNACPTSCPQDTDACTIDEVDQAGTCNAVCVHRTITERVPGDSCCPDGAIHQDDSDCPIRCGDGVKEGDEQCDDGNSTPDDDCDNSCKFVPTAYRFTELQIQDPHLFLSFELQSRDPHLSLSAEPPCVDITSGVNGLVTDGIEGDGTGGTAEDGFLDLSPTIVFRPRQQLPAPSAPVEFYFAQCKAPLEGTTCTPDPAVPAAAITTANNLKTGVCLDKVSGTTNPSYGEMVLPTDECFVSLGRDITLTLSGIPIELKSAQIAAEYFGNPAKEVTDGLLRGFMTEEIANTTTLPETLPIVGGKKLATLLAGSDQNCRSASDSDKDVLNGAPGWWFYINFKAAKVPWTDVP